MPNGVPPLGNDSNDTSDDGQITRIIGVLVVTDDGVIRAWMNVIPMYTQNFARRPPCADMAERGGNGFAFGGGALG